MLIFSNLQSHLYKCKIDFYLDLDFFYYLQYLAINFNSLFSMVLIFTYVYWQCYKSVYLLPLIWSFCSLFGQAELICLCQKSSPICCLNPLTSMLLLLDIKPTRLHSNNLREFLLPFWAGRTDMFMPKVITYLLSKSAYFNVITS